MYITLLVLLSSAWLAVGQPGKCDQTPLQATVSTPTEDKGLYVLTVESGNGGNQDPERSQFYTPDQTYVLTIKATNETRPFKAFMITAEDPEVDENIYEFSHKNIDVGSLKTLDTGKETSRYSERCFSSVENADFSDKLRVEIHWVSPKQSDSDQKVRIRAMVAENSEVWYTGKSLTVVLKKDNSKMLGSPPYDPRKICNLCSEARYEVIFRGKWSRVTHPRLYPSKPDENGYSHMVGASHTYMYSLWQQGVQASDGIKQLAEKANTTELERLIIMQMGDGTRTLIRGKRRHHPFMSEPSYSLFRVDRKHHLFSIAVGMRPSPDWFLGTSRFELCTDDGWLESYEIPLYPWDAGTMDGVSYETIPSITNPKDSVERVEVGSFNKESPFYQMNLNDLKPFATLTIRRLDVFALTDCETDEEEQEQEDPVAEEVQEQPEDELEEPILGESRQRLDKVQCHRGEWGEWSPCMFDDGECGTGFRTRTRSGNSAKNNYYETYNYQDSLQAQSASSNCEGDQDSPLIEYQKCFVDCY